MDKANDRQERLTESLEAHQLVREARELTDYVNDKKALLLSSAKPSEDVEQVEVIQRKFDDYQKVNRLKIQSLPCLFKILYSNCHTFGGTSKVSYKCLEHYSAKCKIIQIK